MADKVSWLGTAVAVAQVTENTVSGTVAAGETFTATINNVAVSYEAESGDTANTVATELAALINASANPAVTEVEAEVDTATITLTARTAGVPFTVAFSEDAAAGSWADGASGTEVTASSGPNYWSVAANWLTDAGANEVPASDDTVNVDGTVPILYGLDNNALEIDELNISGSVQIGLPPYNERGYAEHREQYLKIRCPLTRVNTQSGLVRLNLGSAVASTVNVYGTGQPTSGQCRALTLRGTNASNAFHVFSGDVGIAQRSGETATAATVIVGSGGGGGFGQTVVEIGPGATLTNVTVAQGELVTLSSWSGNLVVQGGTANVMGSAAGVVYVRDGGVVNWKSSGSFTCYGGPKGYLDMTQDLRARTCTAMTVYAGFVLNDSYKTVSWPAGGITVTEAGNGNSTLNFGASVTMKIS
jgi:hypothetical protein